MYSQNSLRDYNRLVNFTTTLPYFVAELLAAVVVNDGLDKDGDTERPPSASSSSATKYDKVER